MIIGYAQERKDSPQGSFELDKHTLTRKFIVQTNNIQDGPIQVTAAIGIPRMFQLYITPTEHHNYARCREINAERVDKGSLFWEIECKYWTPKIGEGSTTEREGQNDNPLLRIPSIELHPEIFEIPVFGVYSLTDDNDLQYKPLAATTGEIFDPCPVKKNALLQLSIVVNQDITSPAATTAVAFTNTVNNDVFWGCAPGQAMCTGIGVAKETKQLSDGETFSYLKVTYNFSFKTTWDIQILNAGNYYFKKAASLDPTKEDIKYQFLTDSGSPRKGLLAADGTALAKGANPLFITFRPYPRQAFRVLNLPQSFIQAA